MLVCSKEIPHSMKEKGLPSRQGSFAQVSWNAGSIAFPAKRLQVCNAVAATAGNGLDVVLGRTGAVEFQIRSSTPDAGAKEVVQNLPFSFAMASLEPGCG